MNQKEAEYIAENIMDIILHAQGLGLEAAEAATNIANMDKVLKFLNLEVDSVVRDTLIACGIRLDHKS